MVSFFIPVLVSDSWRSAFDYDFSLGSIPTS